ncbi:hypothetical protein KXS00_10160 [Olivibacter jilunii]
MRREQYNIKIGDRITASNDFVVKLNQYNSSTMITLTREAIDSSNEQSE